MAWRSLAILVVKFELVVIALLLGLIYFERSDCGEGLGTGTGKGDSEGGSGSVYGFYPDLLRGCLGHCYDVRIYRKEPSIISMHFLSSESRGFYFEKSQYSNHL